MTAHFDYQFGCRLLLHCFNHMTVMNAKVPLHHTADAFLFGRAECWLCYAYLPFHCFPTCQYLVLCLCLLAIERCPLSRCVCFPSFDFHLPVLSAVSNRNTLLAPLFTCRAHKQSSWRCFKIQSEWLVLQRIHLACGEYKMGSLP